MADTGGLAAHIQREVDRGTPRQEIIAGLLQRGLSQPSAERFVDRAVAARDAGLADAIPPPKPRSGDDEEDEGGRSSLIGGAFWLSFGCSVTGITYLLAKPGGRYMLAYGAMAGGLVAFVRGLKRFLDAGPAPFPWKGVTIAAALPLLGMLGLVGFTKWRQESRRAAARAAVEASEAEKAKAADEVAAREKAEAASEAQVQERVAQVERRLKLLRNRSASWSGACGASLELGRMGAREAIPDLYARLDDAAEPGLQNCAAEALVALGEIDRPLAFYVTSSQSSSDDAQRAAIMGFGKIGHLAAPAAMAFLTAEVKSPDSTHRYLAVEALSKMGREAIPALRIALDDGDPMVKNTAAAALKQLGES